MPWGYQLGPTGIRNLVQLPEGTGPQGPPGASGMGPSVVLASSPAFSTTSLAAVAGMTLPVLANTAYVVRLMGRFRAAATTTGIALALDIPSGSVSGFAQHATSSTGVGSSYQIGDASTASVTSGVQTANADVPIHGEWLVLVGATGGNISLMCRSEVSGSAVTLQSGMRLFALAV